jgi:hypothetical protein
MPISVNGANGITFADGSIQNTGAAGFGFKNRIMNGAMVIDQRNAGGSVTPASGITYTVDRWHLNLSQSSKVSALRNAGSVTPPDGFTNYLGLTSQSAYSVGSGDYHTLRQGIEGYNVSDLNWGSANAKTATLSFWVRSSLTGTFGGSINNAAYDRSYPYTYTISAANTWEYKTVIIPGDTSGTWLTNDSAGINVGFGLGTGSTFLGTAGTWSGSTLLGATGQTNLLGTNNATFYITGVQLEKGSTATAFDYRNYGHELQLCQRYYEHTYDIGVAAGTATENGWAWIGSDIPSATTTGTLQSQGLRFETRKRTQPSMTVWDATGAVGKATRYYIGSGPSNNHTCTTDLITTNSFRVFVAGTNTTTNGAFHWAANAEL